MKKFLLFTPIILCLVVFGYSVLSSKIPAYGKSIIGLLCLLCIVECGIALCHEWDNDYKLWLKSHETIKPIISQLTNSEIGSQHWYNTLLANINSCGFYISMDSDDGSELSKEELVKTGNTISNYSRELIDNFDKILKNKK